jgi:hypothetical protein
VQFQVAMCERQRDCVCCGVKCLGAHRGWSILACFDVVFPCQVGVFVGKECMRQVFVVCGRCEVRLCSFRSQCVRGSGIVFVVM